MSTDLVAQLRAPPKGANFVEVDEGNWAVTVYPFGELCHKAADEIERLTAINRLRFSDEQAKEIERLERENAEFRAQLDALNPRRAHDVPEAKEPR